MSKIFKDKFNLSMENNMELAKRQIIDNIYRSARLENVPVTFPETQAIYEGTNVSHLRIDEIQIINNLKHSWLFIFSVINQPISFTMFSSINSLIGTNLFSRNGQIRIDEVKIQNSNGVSKYIPPLPEFSDFDKYLHDSKVNATSKTEELINLMCKLMKAQMFNDGNKRSTMLLINHEFIKNGLGVVTIFEENKVEFGELLIKYYESENEEDLYNLKSFIYDNCIIGLKERKITKDFLEEEKKQEENAKKMLNDFKDNIKDFSDTEFLNRLNIEETDEDGEDPEI